jgi:hypothetical protein
MIAAIDVFQSSLPSPECVASPSSVAEQIYRRLQTSPYPLHRNLRSTFRNGVLTLHGRVSSYYLRQMAWALVADIEGLEEFVDRIEVADEA